LQACDVLLWLVLGKLRTALATAFDLVSLLRRADHPHAAQRNERGAQTHACRQQQEMSDTRAELADLKQHLRGMQAEFANQMAEFARTVVESLAAAPAHGSAAQAEAAPVAPVTSAEAASVAPVASAETSGAGPLHDTAGDGAGISDGMG
jgi:hypothetical protein